MWEICILPKAVHMSNPTLFGVLSATGFAGQVSTHSQLNNGQGDVRAPAHLSLRHCAIKQIPIRRQCDL